MDDRVPHAAGRGRRPDPSIPAPLATQLHRHREHAARALARAAADGACPAEHLARLRLRLRDVELALGLRGRPWWLSREPEHVAERLDGAVRSLLRQRGEGKSICPSEAARVVGGERWRDLMGPVMERARQLERDGWLRVTQRGEPVAPPTSGPVRLVRCRARPE